LAFFQLEGQGIHDKEQFLKHAATVFHFPEYFGNNWDAFADCLTDMSWHEAPGFVILYHHFDSLAMHSPNEFETIMDIFKDSTAFWGTQGKAMFVLLHGKSAQAGNVPKICL